MLDGCEVEGEGLGRQVDVEEGEEEGR